MSAIDDILDARQLCLQELCKYLTQIAKSPCLTTRWYIFTCDLEKSDWSACDDDELSDDAISHNDKDSNVTAPASPDPNRYLSPDMQKMKQMSLKKKFKSQNIFLNFRKQSQSSATKMDDLDSESSSPAKLQKAKMNPNLIKKTNTQSISIEKLSLS